MVSSVAKSCLDFNAADRTRVVFFKPFADAVFVEQMHTSQSQNAFPVTEIREANFALTLCILRTLVDFVHRFG